MLIYRNCLDEFLGDECLWFKKGNGFLKFVFNNIDNNRWWVKKYIKEKMDVKRIFIFIIFVVDNVCWCVRLEWDNILIKVSLIVRIVRRL